MPGSLFEIILTFTQRVSAAPALREAGSDVTYKELARIVAPVANMFFGLNLDYHERMSLC